LSLTDMWEIVLPTAWLLNMCYFSICWKSINIPHNKEEQLFTKRF